MKKARSKQLFAKGFAALAVGSALAFAAFAPGFVPVARLAAAAQEETAAEPAASIDEFSLTLTDGLAVKFYATLPENAENVKMDISFCAYADKAAYTRTIEDYTLDEEGKYVFVYDGVTPQHLNDEIQATLSYSLNGETFQTSGSNSLKAYLESLLSDGGDGMSAASAAAMKQLAADLLHYGAALQTYVGHDTENLADVNAGGYGSEFTAVGDEYAVQMTDEVEESVQWTAAGLHFSDRMGLYFNFTAADAAGYKVTASLGDEERTLTPVLTETENEYIVYYKGISVLDFDEPVEVQVVDADGTAVSERLFYSVNTYVYNKQGGEGAMADLARASYNYGVSAEAYAALEGTTDIGLEPLNIDTTLSGRTTMIASAKKPADENVVIDGVVYPKEDLRQVSLKAANAEGKPNVVVFAGGAGGGIVGTGTAGQLSLVRHVFANLGENAVSFTYYYTNNDAFPGCTPNITLLPGEAKAVDIYVDVGSIKSGDKPWTYMVVTDFTGETNVALGGYVLEATAEVPAEAEGTVPGNVPGPHNGSTVPSVSNKTPADIVYDGVYYPSEDLCEYYFNYPSGVNSGPVAEAGQQVNIAGGGIQLKGNPDARTVMEFIFANYGTASISFTFKQDNSGKTAGSVDVELAPGEVRVLRYVIDTTSYPNTLWTNIVLKEDLMGATGLVFGGRVVETIAKEQSVVSLCGGATFADGSTYKVVGADEDVNEILQEAVVDASSGTLTGWQDVQEKSPVDYAIGEVSLAEGGFLLLKPVVQ